MAVKANTTTSADIVFAREMDFVSRFGTSWRHLADIMGIMRPIKKAPGTTLKSKTAVVTLQDSVAEGEEIPYSKATVTEKTYAEITIEKYAKGVTAEAISAHGYEAAVQMTDDAFLVELQKKVTNKFYTYLGTGTLKNTETSFQRALAMAKGAVINKFETMNKTASKVVGFANIMDFYDYLGDKEITVQSEFGFNYLKNFLGYEVLFLLSDSELAQGKVIATPAENIVLYYVDPEASDFARAGLTFTVEGETNLIGFHTEGNYKTMTSECFALMGMVLFAEYLDGIAVYTIEEA